MKIGRDCSSPLHSGSLALSSISLRSQTLPCFSPVGSVDMMTPLACRPAPITVEKVAGESFGTGVVQPAIRTRVITRITRHLDIRMTMFFTIP